MDAHGTRPAFLPPAPADSSRAQKSAWVSPTARHPAMSGVLPPHHQYRHQLPPQPPQENASLGLQGSLQRQASLASAMGQNPVTYAALGQGGRPVNGVRAFSWAETYSHPATAAQHAHQQLSRHALPNVQHQAALQHAWSPMMQQQQLLQQQQQLQQLQQQQQWEQQQWLWWQQQHQQREQQRQQWDWNQRQLQQQQWQPQQQQQLPLQLAPDEQQPAGALSQQGAEAESAASCRAKAAAEAEAAASEAKRKAQAEAMAAAEAKKKAQEATAADAKRKAEAEAEAVAAAETKRKAEAEAVAAAEAKRKAREAAAAEAKKKAQAEAAAAAEVKKEAEAAAAEVAEAKRKAQAEAAAAEVKKKTEAAAAVAKRKSQAEAAAAEVKRKAQAQAAAAAAEAKRKAVNDVDEASKALALTNRHRGKHSAPPVSLDTAMSARAQAWAEHMAATAAFKHGGHSGEGQNLYMCTARSTLSMAVDAWYEEVHDYRFTNTPFTDNARDHSNFLKIGHFTQLVWRDTQKIGFGIATAKGGATYIACHYGPPGNYMSDESYKANVFSPTGANN